MLETYLVDTYYTLKDRLHSLNKEIQGYKVTDPFTQLKDEQREHYLWLLDARDSLQEAVEALGRLMK